MRNSWMVRAGQGSRNFETFRDENIVAVDWRAAGDLRKFTSRKKLAEHLRSVFPEYTEQMAIVAAGQLYRFVNEVKIGDRMVTYDGRARSYLCGTVTGEYVYDPAQEIEGLTNRRSVKLDREWSRDDLSQSAQYSLGATLALFQISAPISAELWGEPETSVDAAARSQLTADAPATAAKEASTGEAHVHTLPASLATVTFAEIEEQAAERIKDRIAQLNWDQMQQLVAGLLRAMGYVTQVTQAGADRGRDIVASPDGFGFLEPRIVVEVKHRQGRMGAPEIRKFLGGRKQHEKGLYVSIGGFTQEANYEAERASIPLTLMDSEQLIDALLRNYSKLDDATRQLLPLAQLYWPL